jgi:hypothetical protein
MKGLFRGLVPTVFSLSLICVAPFAAAATYVVDTTLDNVTTLYTQCTAAPGNCSLRGAVQRANANPGADVIEFSVPVVDDPNCNAVTGGCRFGLPQGALMVTDELTIDGYTQSGATPNTILASSGALDSVLKIELNNAGVANGAINSSKALTVKGLIFNIFSSAISSQSESAELTVQGCWFHSTVDGVGVAAGGAGAIYYSVNNVQNGQTLRLQIGGLLPAQRNWFPAGSMSINTNVGFNQTPIFTQRVEGNLFGVGRDAMSPGTSFPGFEGIAFYGLSTSTSSLVIGGTDPNARNIFGNLRVGITGGGINNQVTQMGRQKIIGNSFGVGKDGLTPLPVEKAVETAGTDIGGLSPSEANLFVGVINTQGTSRAIANPANARVLGNRYRGFAECAICASPEDNAFVLQPNDPGDPDGYGFSGGTKQNFPEISAVSQTGNQLTITYKVDTAAANATYPLDIEFYKGVKWAGEEILGRDVYSTPQADRTVTLTIPAGISFGADDVVLATANAAAPAGGASRFSWHPSVLTIIGNAPGYVGVPLPVRVRMQSIGGVYRPRGDVVISPEVLGAVGCTATLQPTAFPSVSEGTCNILFTRADDVGPNKVLRVSYAVQGLPYAGEDGRAISVTRNITVLTNDIFCHGFEGSSTGACRALP